MKSSIFVCGLLAVLTSYPLYGAVIFTNNSAYEVTIIDTRMRTLYSVEQGQTKSLDIGNHPSHFYLFYHEAVAHSGAADAPQKQRPSDAAFMLLPSACAIDITLDITMIEEKRLPTGVVFLTHRPLTYAEAVKRIQTVCQPCAARKAKAAQAAKP